MAQSTWDVDADRKLIPYPSVITKTSTWERTVPKRKLAKAQPT